jgi:hypothetical protein
MKSVLCYVIMIAGLAGACAAQILNAGGATFRIRYIRGGFSISGRVTRV